MIGADEPSQLTGLFCKYRRPRPLSKRRLGNLPQSWPFKPAFGSVPLDTFQRRCIFRGKKIIILIKKKIAPFFLQVDTLEDDAFHCGLFCGSVGGRCGTLPRFSSPNPLSGAPDRWHDITGQAGSTMQRSRGPLISGARVRNPPVLWERARGVLHTLSHRNGPQMEPCCLPIQGLQSADLHFDVARRNKALSSADLYRLAD